jgi:2-keto-4-pentenoate hydratase/2-oxohepta-3-ene-1,7-dioic acid hydratase in catechol pathway
MKLASFSAQGRDRIGLQLPSGALVDLREVLQLSQSDAAIPMDMLALINSDVSVHALLTGACTKALAEPQRFTAFDPAVVSWHPPVRTPSKIVCVALNNRALDAVKIRAPTDHPAFFLKPSTALTGHLQPIRLRASFGLTHPEPELGVVIGKKLSDATPAQAMASVFGYTIVNDVTSVGMREEDSFSVRYFKPGPQPGDVTVGEAHTTYPGRYKASDSFAPMGPWLVTVDEIPDPAALTIQCWVGEKLVASDHTSNYVWSVPLALSHISRTMTLLPGDIVSMGTAVGGDADDPAAPLVPGVTRATLLHLDGKVTVSIERLGTLANPVLMI